MTNSTAACHFSGIAGLFVHGQEQNRMKCIFSACIKCLQK